MNKDYYRLKWKIKPPQISRETLRNNINLRRFIRIRQSILIFNVVASATILAAVFTGVL